MFWYLTPKYKRLAKDRMCEKNFNMKDKEQKKQKKVNSEEKDQAGSKSFLNP